MSRPVLTSAAGRFRYSRRTLLGHCLAAVAVGAIDPVVHAAPAADPAAEPSHPGAWRTWLLTSGDERRPAEPSASTSSELEELRDLQAQRTAATAAIVAKWAIGPAILPWTDLTLDLIRVHRPNPIRAARALALLHAALHDAIVASWDAKAAYSRAAPWQVDDQLTVLGRVDAGEASFPSEHAVVAATATTVLARGLAVAGGLVLVKGGRDAWAQEERLTASGGGVNVKEMPGRDGGDPVPLRKPFSFDAHFAQCIIEDNPAAFTMDTFEMGQVVIEAHGFFMAMYARDVNLVSVQDAGGGKRVAKLTGDLGCATEAGTTTARFGSRTEEEPAFFEIEAVDGGHGGGMAGDRFAFTVFFDPKQAPLNHAIFGPNPTFTGEMVAGEVTIDAASTLPLLAADAGTPIVSPP